MSLPATFSTSSTESAWQSGLEPEALAAPPGSHDAFILAIAVVLILVLFNFGTLRRMLRFYVDELVNVRQGRDNVFDDRPASFSGMQLLLTGVFVGCAGFLLVPEAMMAGMALALGYYLFELTAYEAVGYTFATEEGRREWVRGFSASTSLLAMALAGPSLVAVFYPGTVYAMAVIGLILFIIAKILFILKGFRIFYNNFFSLLYFILYLCTLEIIPIILVYNCSVRFI